MADSNKHVVFDVVGMSPFINLYHDSSSQKYTATTDFWPTGTLISYENFYIATEARLGPRLRELGIGTRLFCYCWMEAGEREYTYLSLAGKYIPFFDVFRAVFYRTLYQAGIPEPREFATDEDREFVLDAYRNLKARPGVAECFDRLRRGGFTVWCLTAGDTGRVGGYLKAAGVDFPEPNFVSCDNIGVGKPSPEAYKFILDKFPEQGREAWFAAAHMWDTTAARPCG